MTVKAIKIKGEKLSILSHATSAEQLISGDVTGETPTGWNLKVKDTYVYWVDKAGAERRSEGTLTGGTKAYRYIQIHGPLLYYGDINGAERSLSAADFIIYEGTIGHGVVARASDGRLWAVYTVGNDMFASYSDDNGGNWTADATIATESYSGVTYGPHIDIVIDSNDVPHVVYSVRTGTTQQRRIYYVHRTGGSWQTKADVFGSTDYWLNPKIAIDSNNDIHCVCGRDTLSSAKIVYFRQFSGVWASQVIIATKRSRHQEQDIAIDSTDHIHVVYCGTTTTRDIHYKLNNGSWQAEEDVGGFGDGTDQERPLVEVDSGDVVHIVWSGRGYGGTFEQINYRKGNTSSWNAIVNLTQATQPQGVGLDKGLELAINANDDIDICWDGAGYSTPSNKITGNHIRYTSSAWGSIDVYSDNSNRTVGIVREDNLLATGYLITYLVIGGNYLSLLGS